MPEPPVAKKEPHEYEIHDLTITDDYFWLRNKDTEDVINYLEAENNYTKEMTTDTTDLETKIFTEMKERIKETDESVPMKDGDYYYYYRTVKGKNYRIYCRKYKLLTAPEEIILDGNVLAEGKKYMSLGSLKISPNHKMIAYSVDFKGRETYDTYIVDLDTGEIRDQIKQVGSQIVWDNDSKAIFYSELDDIHREYAISCHQIGTNQSKDKRLVEEPDTSFQITVSKSSDKKYLFFDISAGQCYYSLNSGQPERRS